MLTTILVVESTILFFGYWFREEITKGFHAAMSNGLQWYGKEPSLSSVVDDIQSTVRQWKNLKPYSPLTLCRVRVYTRVTPLKGRKSPP